MTVYRAARRHDAAFAAVIVHPDVLQALSNADIFAALVLQPVALHALSIAATLDEFTLQPDDLHALSTAETFAELRVHPDVLQAFTAAVTFGAETLNPADLQERSIDAACTDETGYPAALHALMISAEVVQVLIVSLEAACATGIIETMTVNARATLKTKNHLLLRKAFITDLRIEYFPNKCDSDVTNITEILRHRQLIRDNVDMK